MLILGTDTAFRRAHAAVFDTETGVFTECTAKDGLSTSESLMPLIGETLETAGALLHDIDVFAVTTGPGSFTGLRIGIAAVKGLAYAEEKPCRGVSTLHAGVATLLSCNSSEDQSFVITIDARGGNYYRGIYNTRGRSISPAVKDATVTEKQALCELKELALAAETSNVHFITMTDDGFEFNITNGFFAECKCRNYAVGACLAALETPDLTPRELMPQYLRLSSAERERAQRLGQEEAIQ